MFRQQKTARFLSPAIALALMAPAVYAPVALAQEDAADLEEIIVTGARGRPRTVSDSPVPIDVFDASDIEAISYTDTNDIIKTLVPSFNISRQPISDGASFIRPAELRGLPTDKTLVLINSKRRHRAALVAIGGSGTQGPDMATIPAVAIQNIEVLRDGAAAQYGSDAIAGVINFLLKDNREGGSVSIDSGQYHEGDGGSTTVQGNIGLPLGDNGFLSISGEFYEAAQTTRAEQYCNSWFCLDQGNPEFNNFGGSRGGELGTRRSYATGADARGQTYLANINLANIGDGDVVQPWGQPDAEAARVFFNAGIDLDGNNELYGFGNFSDSTSNGSFFYRYPYNGTIEELREPDGSIYFPLEIHPGGFTPRFFGDVRDMSVVGGVRGEMDSGLGYDFSVRTGESEIQYTLSNTINPSMGPDSPTSFRPGDLINAETQLQADFTYDLDNGALFAFGASWMDESYDVVQGEEVSYRQGPYALPDPWGFCNAGPDGQLTGTGAYADNTPTARGMEVIAGGSTLDCASGSDAVFRAVGVGSNGFPGYSPEFSDVYERNSYALYGDLSGDVTDELFLQAAVRYEDYEDFDAEIVWKLAGQLDVTDNFGLRASIGTAFRAPTPGQQGTTNVSTRLPAGFPVATGLFPAGGPIAQALGAVPLKPEKSDNYTIGFTAQVLDTIDVTVDFYRIDVQDRTQAISTLDVSSSDDDQADNTAAWQNFVKLRDAGVAGANSIGGVFYFTNGFNTSTQGMDVVATTPIEWGEMGTTILTASFNYTENSFDTDPSEYLNAEARFDFENFDPNWRGVITARHEVNQLTLIGRLSYYGESINSQNGTTFQTFDPIWYTDIEGQYRFNDMFRLSVGARNVWDEYPAQDSIGDYCCGRLYSSATGMDWQGAYYYGRLTVDF